MPARKGGKDFSVAVEGLAELAAIPGWLEEGQRKFLELGATRLRDEVARKAPGGARGRAGRDVEAKVLSSTRAVIRSKGWIGAKTLERGATIKPKKKGGALKLSDGRFVRGKVVVKGRGYFKKGLRPRSKIIRQAYSEAFDDLHQYGGPL